MSTNRIAIDGGAATGKSTVAKAVANELGLRYINTGQMYRLFALVAIRNDIVTDEDKIFDAIKDLDVSYNSDGDILSNDVEFELNEITSSEIAPFASKISAMPKVRQVASAKQIALAKQDNVVLEGRDIGTVIMPDATHKFFLKVDPKVAAERRYYQELEKGQDVTKEGIYKFIVERNERDINREVAPLVPTPESIIIDTTDIDEKEVARLIIKEINE